jgi:hypothetical protein
MDKREVKINDMYKKGLELPVGTVFLSLKNKQHTVRLSIVTFFFFNPS